MDEEKTAQGDTPVSPSNDPYREPVVGDFASNNTPQKKPAPVTPAPSAPDNPPIEVKKPVAATETVPHQETEHTPKLEKTKGIVVMPGVGSAETPPVDKPAEQNIPEPKIAEVPRNEPVPAAPTVRMQNSSVSTASREEEVEPSPPTTQTDNTDAPSVDPSKLYVGKLVTPLRTYELDAASALKNKDASVVKIQQAEIARKQSTRKPVVKKYHRSIALKEILLAVLVVVGVFAIGLGIFAFTNNRPEKQVVLESWQPFVASDVASFNAERSDLLSEIRGLRDTQRVSSGYTVRVIGTREKEVDGENVLEEIFVDEVFGELGINIPEGLVRSLTTNHMLGFIDTETDREFFMISEIDFYQNAFASLLAWERTMVRDLEPLIGTPDLFSYDEILENIESTLEGGEGDESEPSQTSGAFLGTKETVGFKDRIIQNRDIRALTSDVGEVVLLYSLVDRETLILTTSEEAFGLLLEKIYGE